MEHTQFTDGGHHLPGDDLESVLECVDLLSHGQSLLSTIYGLFPEFVRESRDFIQNEFFLEKSLFLLVQPFFQNRYLGF